MSSKPERTRMKLHAHWCHRAYSYLSDTLFEPPPDISPEDSYYFRKNRKYYSGVFARLEVFVEAIIDDPTLGMPPHSLGSTPLNLKNFPLLKYFRSIPKFLQVVGFLSDLYTYNEHVNVFISCSKKMKLRHADINWEGLNSAEVKKPLEYTHFFELARMIREECLSSKIRLAVSKRRHEAQARFDNYCDYIDLCFEKYSKLIFLRIDLHYKASIAPQITAEQTVADLDRLLSNTRHNKIFNGWVGYIAKLEYGAQKHLHWHLIVILDGHVRKGTSHIDFGKDIGKYWNRQVTKGAGAYWNCNKDAKEFMLRNICGIGDIHYSDTEFRMNLETEVLAYLTKTTQLLRPKFGPQVRTIRRGLSPKVTKGSKRGRKRARFESYMAHIYRLNQPSTLTMPTYPE